MPRLLTFPRLRPAAYPNTDRDLVRRFADAADPEAFAELVRRHGPAVLGVCRRAVRDAHLADDAFQATFLVLARRAGSLRDPAAVGSWLFGVARRTATAARRRVARVQKTEGRCQAAADPRTPDLGLLAAELCEALDAELARLPDKLRAPLLACYHDGRTQDEAARHLGLGLNTVRRRLERGRELLRVRMTARGATLGAGLFGGVLAPAAAVPEPLVRAAVDHAAGGPVPGRVLALAASGVPAVKWAAAVLVAVGGLAVGFGGARPVDGPPKADPPKPAAARPDPPDPLPKGAVARMGSPRLRHPGGMQTLAFALGGKVLISAHYPAACVWDAKSGKLLRTLGRRYDDDTPGGIDVGAVGVTGDGRRLIAQANRVLIRHQHVNRNFVWDLERDAEDREFVVTQPDPQKGGAIRYPNVFAPDGSRLAAVDGHGPAKDIWLWDADGKPAGRLEDALTEQEGWRREPVAFAPDGKLLYVARVDHTIDVWDTATHKRVRRFGTGQTKPAALAVSADGKALVTFALAAPPKDRAWQRVPEAVRIWDPAKGEMLAEFPWEKPDPDGDHAAFVGFLPDGSAWAAAASYTDLTFRQWNAQTGRADRSWTVPNVAQQAGAVAVSPDGTRLAAGSQNGIVLLFDAATGKDLTPGGGHRDEITDLRFAPDARQLVTVAGDRTARVWDAGTGREQKVIDKLHQFSRLTPDAGAIYGAKYTPVGGKDAWTLVARDIAAGRELWQLEGPGAVVPNPDGKTVLGVEFGSKATVIDAGTGKVVRTVPAPGFPLAFGDGGRLAVSLDGKAVSGWDAATGRKRFAWDPKEAGLLRSGPIPMQQNLEYADAIDAAAASPDGKHLAVVVSRNLVIEDDQSSLYVCEADTGKVVWRAKSDTSFGRSVAFSPDGKTVAVAGWTAKVFDAATGDERAAFDGHRGAVSVVAFSPDGKWLATGGADGTAVVWQVPRK